MKSNHILTGLKKYFFSPRFHFNRFQFNLVAILFISLGLIIGSYLTLSKILPSVFASTNASVTKDTDTDFNQGSYSSSLIISGIGSPAAAKLIALPASTPYWRAITINNASNSATLSDYQVPITLDTATLISGGKLQSDCRDIRIQDYNGVEIPNYWIEKCNSATTKIWVKVPSIPASSSKIIYLFYGSGAGTSSQSSTTNTFIREITNVVGSWGFDETVAGTTLADRSGRGNNGTVQNEPQYIIVDGKFGKARLSDGMYNSYYFFGTNLAISGNASMSASIWFDSTKPASGVKYFGYLGNGYSYDSFSLTLGSYGHSGDNRLGIGYNGSGEYTSAINQFTPNVWHNFVGTKMPGAVNTTSKLYLDGTEIQSEFGTTGTPNFNFTNNYFDLQGMLPNVGIDEYIIYNKALSAAEVTDIANNYVYTTTNYPGKGLVKKYSSPEPTSSAGSEQGGTVSGTWESPTDSNTIDLRWNGGWGDGTISSPAFSAAVTNVNTTDTITFAMRVATSSSLLSSSSYVTIGTVNSGTTFTKTKGDLDALGIATGNNRYAQVKATISKTTANTTPSLDSFSINYLRDNSNPDANPAVTGYANSTKAVPIPNNSWTNVNAPYFQFANATDPESGIQGYCVYFGTDSSADPATTKGLLSTSEQPIDNSACPYVTYNPYIDLSTHLVSLLSTNTTYYLNIRSKDYQGNLYSNSSYSTFTYKFDNTSPVNLTGISAPQTYQSQVNSFVVYWATTGGTAATDNLSQVKGYQYKINNGTWFGSGHTGTQDCTDLITTGSYALNNAYDSLNVGENTFYLRVYDNACNVSATNISTILKYSGIAPTEPQNLQVNPSSNTQNSFAFSWSVPATFAGLQTGINYCYSTNALPSNVNCSWTSSTTLTADAYATQPGENTLYVVAKDEAGNVNYNAYASVKFTANTSAPGAPSNLDVSDISIKATSNWKLTASWDIPTETGAGVSVYKIFRSTTNSACTTSLSSFTQIGSTAGTSYTDTGLIQQTYYYCVKACDSANNCSASSTTVSKLPTGKYYSPANLVSLPVISSITTKRATISWSTDRTSDSKIQFGTTSGSYNDVQPSNSSQVTSHSIELTGLNPGTTYYFKAQWTDEDGNTGTSDEQSFSTQPAPSVQDVTAGTIGLSSALVSFTTNGADSVKIYYGTTTSFGGVITTQTSTAQTTYTSQLTGLLDGTKYYFKINTFDSDGTEYDGTVLDFTTLPRPKISSVRLEQVANTAQTTVLVTWSTNTEVSSIITYYPENNLTGSKDEVKVALEKGPHSMFVRGLLPQTNYALVVRGRDKIGNEAISDTQTFTTATDTRPPQIINLKVVGGTVPPVGFAAGEVKAQLVITWDTDEPATSQVEFGEGTGSTYVQKSQEDGNLTTNHAVILSNLTPSQVYHLRAISKDAAGNEAQSIDQVTIAPKATKSALDLVVKNLSEAFSFVGALKLP